MEIVLKKGCMEAVVTTKGGELISFKDEEGIERIWQGDPEYWTGRNPLLFPVVGNLKEGKIKINGETYSMNRHGFAREREFVITEQAEDHVVMELRADEDTLKKYPFNFKLQVCHRLEDSGFVTSFEIVNLDKREMPFCIGAHTAFCCPVFADETFEDYDIVFDEKEQADSLLLNSDGYIQKGKTVPFLRDSDRFALNYEPFEKMDTVIFSGLKSTGVSLKHRLKGHGVHMDFEGFTFMAFWTKGAQRAPFICIEPWHGCAALEDEDGDFKHKEACICLQPGERKEFLYKVKILQG